MTLPKRLALLLSLVLTTGGVALFLCRTRQQPDRFSEAHTSTGEQVLDEGGDTATESRTLAERLRAMKAMKSSVVSEHQPSSKRARAPFAAQRLPKVRSVDTLPHSNIPEIERRFRERESRARPLNRRLEQKLEQLVAERERAVGAERARLERKIELLSRLFESRRRFERSDILARRSES